MSQATISLVALGVVVVLLVWNRLPVEVVAIGSALALFFLGVLDFPSARGLRRSDGRQSRRFVSCRRDAPPARSPGRGQLLTEPDRFTNMMVMGPAGYRFTDFWRLGLPMVLLFFVAAVALIPLVWPL